MLYFFVLWHYFYDQNILPNIYYHYCNKSIQDVNEFGTDLKKFVITSLDPLQWMDAIRMRVKTADKDITIIYK